MIRVILEICVKHVRIFNVFRSLMIYMQFYTLRIFIFNPYKKEKKTTFVLFVYMRVYNIYKERAHTMHHIFKAGKKKQTRWMTFITFRDDYVWCLWFREYFFFLESCKIVIMELTEVSATTHVATVLTRMCVFIQTAPA